MWGKAWNKGTKAGKSGKGASKGTDRSQEAWNAGSWNPSGTGTWTTATGSTDWYATGGNQGFDGHTAGPGAAKGWDESAGGKGKDQSKGKGKEWVARLEGKYALAKSILRPYADERGQAVYAQGSVLDFFEKHHMRQIIDARNSELARRPAVGVSVVSSSMLALASLFEEDETEDDRKFHGALQDLRGLFSGEDGTALKRACEILSKDRNNTNSAEKRRKAVETWLAFFRKNKELLQTALPLMLQRTSLLYMGGMQALEAVTLANALGNWSSKIPTTSANEATLTRWQSSPKTVKLLVDYVVEAFGQRHADDAAWKRAYGGWGGDSDDEEEKDAAEGLTWGIPGPIDKKRTAASESSMSSSAKRRRKAAKHEKKRKSKKDARTSEKNDNKKLSAKAKPDEDDGEETAASAGMDETARKETEKKTKAECEQSTSSSSKHRHKTARREEKREEKRKLKEAAKAARKERKIAGGAEVEKQEEPVLEVDDDAVATEAIPTKNQTMRLAFSTLSYRCRLPGSGGGEDPERGEKGVRAAWF